MRTTSNCVEDESSREHYCIRGRNRRSDMDRRSSEGAGLGGRLGGRGGGVTRGWLL